MSESFSVQSRLTISTNVEQVLNQLIESFERFDRVVQESQGEIAGFERKLGEIGGQEGSLSKAFSEIRLPPGLLSELNTITENARTFATESSNAARAWREIAEASKNVRTPAAPPSGANEGGPGPRRGRSGVGGGSDEDEASIFGTAEDRANARWLNSDFLARERFQQKLLEAERKSVQAQIDQREKAEAEQAALEAKLLAAERKAVLGQIEAREKATNQLLQDIANANKRIMREEGSDVYGPRPYNQAIQGTPGERADAERENAWIKANEDAKALVARRAALMDESAHKGPSHHDLGTAAMGFQMAGHSGLSFAEEAVMANFEVQHNIARITGNTNIANDPELLSEIKEQIRTVARDTPGATQADVSEVLQDLVTAFGDPKEALKELPAFTKLVNTLQIGEMHHGGSGDLHQALALARFIEDQGGAVDPKTGLYTTEKFDELAQKATSIAFATNFRVRPTEMLAMMKTARTGGMMMDDHALYEETPYFAQQFGASKLGTALFSDIQVMLANRMTDKTADDLAQFGMFGGKKTVISKSGKQKQVWDPSTLAGEEILRHDPYEWIHDVLGRHIADKLGVDDKTKEGQEAVVMKLTELAQRGTIAGLWGDVYRNYATAQKEGRNIAAQNPDMQQHMLQEDPMAQLRVFRGAENELMVALGELLQGPTVGMLKDLIATLHDFSDWVNANKTLAKTIAEITVGLALFAQVFGTLAMGVFFAKPMFGLLIGGLEALTRALIPFGGGGAAAAGLKGLEVGAESIAAKVSVKAAAAAAGVGVAGGAFIGLNILGGIGGFLGAQEAAKDIAEHGEKGQMPIMLDEWGNAIGYTQPKPDNLVGPRASGPKGTTSDPLVVHVQNQISEDGISRGVTASQARQMNRPPSGYTGSDPTIDPLGAYYGMAAVP